MNRSIGFWNRIAPRYSRNPVPDEAVYARKLALTQERLQPHMQLLEFGCGTGSTALEHAGQVAHIHAIDFSQAMIDIARQKQREAEIENITFECATLEEIGAAGASYDAVLALSVLHLMRGWRDALDETHRLLKPGGLFVSGTACIADFAPWLRPIAALGRTLGLLPELAFIRRRELEQAILDAGFDIELTWQPEHSKSKALFVLARKSA